MMLVCCVCGKPIYPRDECRAHPSDQSVYWVQVGCVLIDGEDYAHDECATRVLRI